MCNESTRSCEYTTTDCHLLDDPCATDQCIETLGGCQFSCGAVLETWTGIAGLNVADLVIGTKNFTVAPSRTEHLGSLLDAPYTMNKIIGSRMKGWLIPPVTGKYVFWIASDDAGELWLSSDGNPDNKVRRCRQLWASGPHRWNSSSEQESTLIALVAGETYYFEVTPRIFLHRMCCILFTIILLDDQIYFPCTIQILHVSGSCERWWRDGFFVNSLVVSRARIGGYSCYTLPINKSLVFLVNGSEYL